MPDPRVIAAITQAARRYGVDPAAALAVAQTEGGLSYGATGDQGTSYGPFQLHVGGALPRGRGAGWANSPAGIDYAVRSMANAGAKGLTGNAAINAIVRRFERPADPDSQVAKAMGYYGGVQPSAAQPAPQQQAPRQPASSQGSTFLKTFLSTLQQNPEQQSQSLTALLQKQAMPAKEAPASNTQPAPPAAMSAAGPIVKTASQALGTKYVWGGESFQEGGFDCSGLLYWAFKKHGISIPRTSQQQWRSGKAVDAANLQPGDAVFFAGYTGGKGGPGHVGIYVGNGQMMVAPQTGSVVQLQDMASHSGYMGARRFI